MDTVVFPPFITRLSEIYSLRLQSFFEKYGLKDNEQGFDLDCIRELYQSDRDLFTKTTNELALRGFCFKTPFPNKVLPKCLSGNEYHILYSTESQMMSNDDLSFLADYNMDYIIDIFQINRLNFFDKIPLEGFKLFNPYLSLDLFAEEFKNRGFEINRWSPDNQQLIASGKLFNEKQKTPNSEILISDFFKDNIFYIFRRICKREGIKRISEINEDILAKFRSFKGIGKKKIELVESKLQSLEKIQTLDESDPSTSINQFLPLDGLIKMKSFLHFCKKKNIESYQDLIDIGTNRLLNAFPAAPRKKREVKLELDRFQKWKYSYKKDTFSVKLDVIQVHKYCLHDLLKFNEIAIQPNNEALIDIQIDHPLAYGTYQLRIPDPALLLLQFDLDIYRHPKESFSIFLSKLSDDEKSIIQKRLIENKTLAEVGEFIKVTRERIRQIEAKLIRKWEEYYNKNRVSFALKLVFSDSNVIEKEEMKSEFNVLFQEFWAVLKRAENMDIKYHTGLNVLYFQKSMGGKIKETDQYFIDLPDLFLFSKNKEEIYSQLNAIGYDFITEDKVNSILQNYGYFRQGNIFSKNKLRKHEMIDIVFMEIDEPIKLDSEGINKINQISREIFNEDLVEDDDQSSIRRVDSIIRRSEKLICLDTNKYKVFDSSEINFDFTETINQWMQQFFDAKKVLNADILYDTFHNKANENGINSKAELYYLLKKLFGDDYSFGRGNTFEIYPKGAVLKEKKDQLLDLVRSYTCPPQKREILKKLHWQPYQLDQRLAQVHELIDWGNSELKLVEQLSLSETFKRKIKEKAEQLLARQNFIFTAKMLKECLFDPEMNQELEENDLQDEKRFSGFLKYIIPDLRGFCHVLYRIDNKINSEDAIAYEFEDAQYLSRRTISEFLENLGYASARVGLIINDLLDPVKGRFIQIDFDKFVFADRLQLDNNTKKIVCQFIKQKLEKRSYVVLTKTNGYVRKLPAIGYKWTPQLLFTIALQEGFRHIPKINYDHRYDQLIIVDSLSHLKDMTDLIHLELSSYKGRWHEVDVYDYLADLGLLTPKSLIYKKVIPKEVFEKNVIQKDYLGNITLVERVNS